MKKGQMNPNIIWEARKRSKGCDALEYNTHARDRIPISNPNKTKEHITSYFEELYQAREGTTEYPERTNKIKKYVKSNLTSEPRPTSDTEEQINERQNPKWYVYRSKLTRKQ